MGFAGWLAYATDRVLSKVSSGRVRFLALRFFLQPLPAKPLAPIRGGDPVSVMPITEGAFEAAAFGRPPEAIRDRYRDGSICIAATRDEELLGFMWLQRGTLRERVVRCHMEAEPKDKVVWDYDFFIQPRYRLGRLFGRLWDTASDLLRSQGIGGTVSWIRLENRASEKAHARLGAKRIGWASFLTLGGYQLMLASFRPYVSLTRPGTPAALRIDVSALIGADNTHKLGE